MGLGYYNRSGEPLTLSEWGALLEDHSYRRIASNVLDDGRWVSTVWLGLDHAFRDGPPIIFETMVFSAREGGDSEQMDRYCTEEEAVAGHEHMVRALNRLNRMRLAKKQRQSQGRAK